MNTVNGKSIILGVVIFLVATISPAGATATTTTAETSETAEVTTTTEVSGTTDVPDAAGTTAVVQGAAASNSLVHDLKMLYFAVKTCHTDTIKNLLQKHPTLSNLNFADHLQNEINNLAPNTALTLSIQCPSNESLTAILQSPATNVNLPQHVFYGTTALMIAAGRGDLSKVQFLLQHGAKVQLHDESPAGYPAHMHGSRWPKRTALAYAVMGGHLPTIKTLVQAGANINDLHLPALSATAFIKKVPKNKTVAQHTNDVVQLLVQLGAQVDQQDRDQHSVLFYATWLINNTALHALLKAKVPAPRASIATLSYAFARQVEKIQKLRLSHTDRFWRVRKLSNRAITTAQLLLKHGADINASHPTQPNDTPLHRVFSVESYDGYSQESVAHFVRALLNHGADPSLYSSDDKTALMTVAYMLHRVGLPNFRVVAKATPLKHINTQNSYGTTALMMLMTNTGIQPHINFLNAVELLLKTGARTDLKDNKGRTALDILIQFRGDEPLAIESIKKLFKNHRARQHSRRQNRQPR